MMSSVYSHATPVLERIFSEKLQTPIRLRFADYRTPAADDDPWPLRRSVHASSRKVLGRMLASAGLGHVFRARRLKFPQRSYSITHCGATIVCAMATDQRINGLGVDLELGREIPDAAGRLYLSRHERRSLEAGTAYTNANLLRVWTVKEALFKADMDNHRRGWLSCYECINPCRFSGKARVRSNPAGKRFKFASIPFQSGFLTVAVNDKRRVP